jgi:glycosyltransferase involved in cell wall biosynthesis
MHPRFERSVAEEPSTNPTRDARRADVTLSVVVPVYNQASAIADNIRVIRERVEAGLGEEIELIVVSDGSIDSTEETVLETGVAARVIHYDRNLGKGYAVKVGALEARGRWVAYVDADLDLDPGLLPAFVAAAEERGLDLAIGSKRHPESQVHYPGSRRAASWLYQQLVRLLFRLDVRDTQVGMKVFSRDVAEQVLPLLLVKRFAFDLELLAVSRALGFTRIEELPIRLEYRFTGSGVRSHAVLRALVDTAAIFYRLRLLRYYERKQTLVGRYGWTRPQPRTPTVSLIGDPLLAERLDYPALEVVPLHEDSPAARRHAAERADGELLAFVRPGALPAVNWLSASVAFLARAEIGAVVTPLLAPVVGDVGSRAAAAIRESRLGGGTQYFRFLPGNLRFVQDFPGDAIVVRRDLFLRLPAGTPVADVCAELDARGHSVLYSPESVVVAAPPPLLGPHASWAFGYGRVRGAAVRRRGFGALRFSSILPLVLIAFVLGTLWLALAGADGRLLLAAWTPYALVVLATSATAAVRFRSPAVGLLVVPGFVATHLTYAVGFCAGLVIGR